MTGGAHAPGRQGNVLAVLDGDLDDAVVNLALALARDRATLVDLLLLAEIPFGRSRRRHGEWLEVHDVEHRVAVARRACGDLLGSAAISLTRRAGPTLVDEARRRDAAGLVIGVPEGGWWARRRIRRRLALVQARATCRVYIVQPSPA